MRPVAIMDPDPEWHFIARMMWDSLDMSGQSDFYQQTDWAFAYSLCDDISEYKKPKTDREGNEYTKRSPEMLKAILSAMTSLLITEGDRRRVRIELSAPEAETTPLSVVAIGDYRNRLGVPE